MAGTRYRIGARTAILALSFVIGIPAAAMPSQSSAPTTDLDLVCLLMNTEPDLDATWQASNEVPKDVPSGMTLFAGVIVSYYGLSQPFNGLAFEVGQAGVDGTLDWSYWNGVRWADLDVPGGATNFDAAGPGSMTFTAPSDWATRTLGMSECPDTPYYFLSSDTGKYHTTPALLDQVSALV